MTDLEKARKKNRRDWIITSILLVIFAFTFSQNVLFRKKKTPAQAEAKATNTTQNMSDQLVVVTNIRLFDNLRKDRVKLWDREWARDPFAIQHVGGSIVKAVNLTLGGILWDEITPKAIINEKILLIGDTLYGYTVEEIRERSVILKTGEKRIELQVFRRTLDEAAPAN